MARSRAGTARLALIAVLTAALAACSPIVRTHGYAPSEEDLSAIVVGVDTRDTVAEVVGTPSANGVMRDNAWYYVANTWETVGPRAPENVDRQVVAVSFAEDGTVENVERFGLEQGRVIALNRRVTDSNVKGISFLRQLLGNIGNFRAEDVIGPDS
ncbi:outer membrane protein assembly factor BamE [Rhodovulum euryhalinum]|uniref:Beta-barrel assembly machine subunit BamE n=1 Tax=Rhodovulum euryhalinum TaxID=35805 RepID=A0A4R2KNP9_9RHOB|nr:outer membrane protein assembly factor BamE [Rhodovulum euryhalinum]TCO72439.1 Beta-barrel assembly machine subunit BamE [Rhodovulum euryhalinum]